MAIVIENPLHPGSAHRAVGAIGKDGGVLDGDVDLVVEAIRNPTFDLIAAGAAGVEQHVEGVMDVVGLTLGAKLRFESITIPGGAAHKSISMPSHAISIPRRPTSMDCAEDWSRMGLVLLMWIRIFRVADGRRSSHSSMPPLPVCGRWPMSLADLRDKPRRIISSSVQNVPSTITHAADCMASQTRASIAPRPGAYSALPRLCSSSISSAILSPMTGESRLGEYGAGLP